jgi:hypothetical protein
MNMLSHQHPPHQHLNPPMNLKPTTPNPNQAAGSDGLARKIKKYI